MDGILPFFDPLSHLVHIVIECPLYDPSLTPFFSFLGADLDYELLGQSHMHLTLNFCSDSFISVHIAHLNLKRHMIENKLTKLQKKEGEEG